MISTHTPDTTCPLCSAPLDGLHWSMCPAGVHYEEQRREPVDPPTADEIRGLL